MDSLNANPINLQTKLQNQPVKKELLPNSNDDSKPVVSPKKDKFELSFKDSSKPVSVQNASGMIITMFDSSVILPKELEEKQKAQQANRIGTNGIQNPKPEAEVTIALASKISEKNIELLHNETYGVIADALEASGEMLDSSIIKQLAKISNDLNVKAENHISLNASGIQVGRQIFKSIKEKNIEEQVADKVYDLVKKGEKVDILAHSQGAAIWADALNIVRDRLLDDTNNLAETEIKMSNISVMAIGGFVTRKDFPSQVKLITANNGVYSRKGLDPVPFIANNNADLLPSVGDLKYKEKVVLKTIAQDPNRGTIEKLYLKGVIKTAIAATTLGIRIERGILSAQNLTAASVVKLAEFGLNDRNPEFEEKYGLKPVGPLDSHGARTGYLNKNGTLDKTVKEFFKD